ncbi:MAG: type II secretion system minor pseudopilin GspK [Betaproteobacteria bacterium]|nr:MAG: type II secretion system minor pseudopilin GspK [Betaproteobacteria bacterium]
MRTLKLTGAQQQNGAAVVMAMLVVAIVAMMVTGVFYRQSIMLRNLENVTASSQARWLMAGAVDWIRVILREDARASSTDHLGEPWAVPLAQTRLNDDERDPAWLSGEIHDGQSRINLRNLVGSQEPVEAEVAVLGRLLALVGENERLAEPIAQLVQSRFADADDAASPSRLLPASFDDLEFTDTRLQAAAEKIRRYVIVLPVPTPVNANTAPAEVLAARFDGLRLVDAQRLVASRDRAAFKDLTDVVSRLGDVSLTAPAGTVVVASRFFVLEGSIEYRRARLHQRALLKRETGRVDVVWRREVRT